MTLLEILSLAPKNAVLQFLSSCGGTRVRVPSLAAWNRHERDEAIRTARGAGATYEGLSLRFSLSERQIRRIVEHERAA